MGLPAKCLKEYGGIETGLFRGWGFNTKTMQFEMKHEDGRVEGGWDIVVFQRWMGKDAARLFEAAKLSGQVIVNDLDDWYWGLATTNQAFHTSHPKYNTEENRNHYWQALGASDLVTVSTPFLAEKVKRLGVPVLHLPNMVDLSLFTRRKVRNTTHPTIGWVGGIPWRSGDLEILKGVLDPILENHGLLFYHGGAWPSGPQANELIGVPDSRYMSSPLVAIDEYPKLMKPIDIGIAPLNDVPFNHAKSEIKLLEYAASGVPFVASALPAYKSYAPTRVAQRPKDWIKMLTRLLDPEERRRQEAENWERVQREDVHVRYKDWLAIIDFANDARTKRGERIMREMTTVKNRLASKGLDLEAIVAAEREQGALEVPAGNAQNLLGRALGIDAAIRAQNEAAAKR